MRIFYIFLFVAVAIGSYGQSSEFRAVWISTVFNTDWPSKAGLSTEQQKAELLQQLDLHQKNGMNAIIFQVSTTSDALYASELAPWSQWLTGKQGQAPNPYYDPLSFVIEEAHKRGMELHAWLNPYRAEIDTAKRASAKTHVSQLHPEWCIAYDRRNYLDPGLPGVRDYVVEVVKEIIKKYPVDGIHMDDYFYPYKIKGLDFKDDKSYKKYGEGFENKADWRRHNVNLIVERLYKEINAVNPQIKFGISPFGIWRNKKDSELGSDSRGMTNYHDLYADVRLWMEKGWLDYVMPQLYWAIGNPAADFAKLTDWWAANAFGRHVYIGIGIYNADKNAHLPRWNEPDQIVRQVEKIRQTQGIQGMGFYSSSTFLKNPYGINQQLSDKYFAMLAQTPEMPWKQQLVAVVDKPTEIKPDVKTEVMAEVNKPQEELKPKPDQPVAQLANSPRNFRMVRHRNEILLAWEHPDVERNKGMRFRVYRYNRKEAFDVNTATLYAETMGTSLMVKRKAKVLLRHKYAFVVVAVDGKLQSAPSEMREMRLKKGETTPYENPDLVLY